MNENQPISLRFLSGNALKLIAALTMLIDHVGMMFFPQHLFLRIIGRLSFPIYAFMVAEGCHYTKNRLRYFLSVFLLGALCQVVYSIFAPGGYMNILLTFACAIPIIYLLQECKQRQSPEYWVMLSAFVAFVYILCQNVAILYGFWGVMLAVFAALFQPPRGKQIPVLQNCLHVLFLGIGLILLSADEVPAQYYSLLALPLLLLYSGQRGKGNFKYAFYLFYPLHLVALQAIAWLLS